MRLGSILLCYKDLMKRIQGLSSLLSRAKENQESGNPDEDIDAIMHEMHNCMDLMESYLISIALKNIKFKDTTIEAKSILSMEELKTKLLNQQIEDVDSDNTFCFPTIGDIIYYNPPNFPYVVRKSIIVDIKDRPFLLYLLKTDEEVVRVYNTHQEAITATIEKLESQIEMQKNSLVCTQYNIGKEERLLRVLKKYGDKAVIDRRTTEGTGDD
jgi:hypothetical protein